MSLSPWVRAHSARTPSSPLHVSPASLLEAFSHPYLRPGWAPPTPNFSKTDRSIDLAVAGLRCCTRAFSSCGERGLRFLAVHEVLIAVASLLQITGSSCRVSRSWSTQA